MRAAWENLPEVEQFDVSAGEGEFFRCALTPRDGQDLRPVIFGLVRENGWVLRELTRSRHSLEDIYVQVTKPNDGGGLNENFLDACCGANCRPFFFSLTGYVIIAAVTLLIGLELRGADRRTSAPTRRRCR